MAAAAAAAVGSPVDEPKWFHHIMVEADSHLNLLPVFILDIHKVFEHIDMLSIGLRDIRHDDELDGDNDGENNDDENNIDATLLCWILLGWVGASRTYTGVRQTQLWEENDGGGLTLRESGRGDDNDGNNGWAPNDVVTEGWFRVERATNKDNVDGICLYHCNCACNKGGDDDGHDWRRAVLVVNNT